MNSPACAPPLTSISSVIPAWTSASTAYVTIGRSKGGNRCLFVIRVSGCNRVPEPPARMTPFIPGGTLVIAGARSTGRRNGRKGGLLPRPVRGLRVDREDEEHDGKAGGQGDDQSHRSA